MTNKFPQITAKAKADKQLKFTSLAHHINEELLCTAVLELKADKATGVDQVSVADYLSNGKSNISELLGKLKTKTYKAQPVRRVYIPKPGKAEKRGLGIPTTEDKLVQLCAKYILEAIYEPDFLDCSHGFRPEKSCHTAISRLDTVVMTKPINYIVEIDVRKFFDNLNHYWLLRCLEERISDPNYLWLIRRFLKAGVMENGAYTESNSGSPQGGVISPLLANIYLHYVLDLWFEKQYKKTSRNYMELIRYCDDFVVLFESQNDAKRFLDELRARLAKFGLEVAEDKTRILEFGRNAYTRSKRTGNKVSSFNFLGFTHYCKDSRNGKFIMGHKTGKDNLRRKLSDMKSYIKSVMNMLPLGMWIDTIKRKLSGHYNYFGISGNFHCLKQYYNQTVSIMFKLLNRRSQRRSFNFVGFMEYLQTNPLPQPKIKVNLYKFS
jgi:group II intron reverse transcriptase/maturase